VSLPQREDCYIGAPIINVSDNLCLTAILSALRVATRSRATPVGRDFRISIAVAQERRPLLRIATLAVRP